MRAVFSAPGNSGGAGRLSQTQTPRRLPQLPILLAFQSRRRRRIDIIRSVQFAADSLRLCTAITESRLQSIRLALKNRVRTRPTKHAGCGARMLTRVSALLPRRPSDIFHLCAPLFRPMRFACSHPTDRRERGQNVAWKRSHMDLGAAVWANLGTRGRHCSVTTRSLQETQ